MLFDKFVHVPAIIITAKTITKSIAAGSGVNDGGQPSATEYPIKSIKLSVTGDNSAPFALISDSLYACPSCKL